MRDDALKPVTLPARVWREERTRDALRRRRIGYLFELAKKYAGASQTRIANVTGMSQPDVSRIMRDGREITSIDVLQRVADGLTMPDEARILLGLAPKQWPGTPTRERAEPERESTPTSGQAPCAHPEEHVDLLARLHASSQVDAGAVELLRAHTHSLRLMDRRLGAPAVLGQIRLHITTIEQALRYSLSPGVRTALGWVLADASALAGWQAIDTGDLAQAWNHFERAKHAAREAGDNNILAFAAGEQAYVLLDLGRPDHATELLDHVISENAGRISARVHAWLYAARAEAEAVNGDRNACRHALDQAARLLPDSPDDPDTPYLALDAAHFARWRGNCLARLGEDDAVSDLTAALDRIDGTFTRATASLHCDLAAALITRREHKKAHHHLTQARQLAQLTGSTRQRRRVDQLASALHAS